MTKRAGRKKKSPAPGETTGVLPESQLGAIATGAKVDPESFFWPELSAANVALATASGRGEQVKRLADLRVELRAVSERWPIPAALRERMVFESAKIVIDPKAGFKEKIWANKLLVAMDAINTRPRELPQQVTVVQGENVSVTVSDVLRVLESQSGAGMGDDIDLRDRRILPGSADDYAD